MFAHLGQQSACRMPEGMPTDTADSESCERRLGGQGPYSRLSQRRWCQPLSPGTADVLTSQHRNGKTQYEMFAAIILFRRYKQTCPTLYDVVSRERFKSDRKLVEPTIGATGQPVTAIDTLSMDTIKVPDRG